MDMASFSERLRELSAEDIRCCAVRLQRDEQCVADQVSQWRAELAVDRLIRRQCTRAEAQRATAAGQRAARLVVDVARRRGMALPDGDVSRVARTAAQAARALALGGLARPFLPPLLAQFDVNVAATEGASLSAA
jgi:hypothetical protein